MRSPTPAVLPRKRPDLVATCTRHQHESAIVVKDPVALAYHRMRPDEYFVLEHLNGKRTLEELCDLYEAEHPGERVKAHEMNELLFRLHRLGLTVSDREEQGDRLIEKSRRERHQKWKGQLSGILFIKFPGVDPEPFLRRLYPYARFCFRPAAIVLFITMAIAALCLIVSHWTRFSHEFPSMQAWISFRAIATLAIVIGFVKVMHELGHAFTCKHFGGECHQIGPMLLVFTPALYCDTSDSWTLPNRFARASVGAAGIATEVVIASAATIVWANTGESSLIHYLAMNVMLVCSVSTLLFNANPLLRYDGYYVLSDLCDVPNLGQRSRTLLQATLGNLLFGVPDSYSGVQDSRERFWLLCYAIAAAAYRWVLTALILGWLLWMLRPYRLESVGLTLCAVAVIGLITTSSRPLIHFMSHPGKGRQIRMGRTLSTSLCLAIFIGIVFLPLPSGISVTGKLAPRKEIPVFVTTDGMLEEVFVEEDQPVEKGARLARLSNPELSLQVEQTRARVEKQRVLVEALKASQIQSATNANELPAAESLLAELTKQLQSREARFDALVIKAPDHGVLIQSPQRESQPSDTVSLATWSGLPTDSRNRGCLIESGTELFTLRKNDSWDAEFSLGAVSVQRIGIGNDVKLATLSSPSCILHGKVKEISEASMPGHQSLDRRDHSSGDGESSTSTFRVRVQLSETASQHVPNVVGLQIDGRISTEPVSLAGLTWRTLTRLFRIR